MIKDSILKVRFEKWLVGRATRAASKQGLTTAQWMRSLVRKELGCPEVPGEE